MAALKLRIVGDFWKTGVSIQTITDRLWDDFKIPTSRSSLQSYMSGTALVEDRVFFAVCKILGLDGGVYINNLIEEFTSGTKNPEIPVPIGHWPLPQVGDGVL